MLSPFVYNGEMYVFKQTSWTKLETNKETEKWFYLLLVPVTNACG